VGPLHKTKQGGFCRSVLSLSQNNGLQSTGPGGSTCGEEENSWCGGNEGQTPSSSLEERILQQEK
jgi:hypothetical protein